MTAPLQYGTPPASDPTAVMGRRTLAWIADLLLFLAVVAAGFASMSEYTEIPTGVLEEEACELFEQQNPGAADSCVAFEGDIYLLDTGESGVQTLLSFGWFAFFVIIQGLTGGSPGKLLFGLRVVDQYGARAGVGRSLGRTLLWVVDAAPWIVPIVGPIAAYTSAGHRRVGDLAAGTYVVSSSSVGQPVMPDSAAIPAGQTPWGAVPPTSPPPMGTTWQAPPAAPPPTTGRPDGGDSGRWSPPTAPSTPDLDFSTTDVPPATERVDEAPPTVAPDPDWSRAPDLHVEPPAAPEPAPFAAPGADGPPPAPGPAAASAPPSEPAPPRFELPPPQWDPARNTYLQWEPNRQLWLQWDAAAERWKPIDT